MESDKTKGKAGLNAALVVDHHQVMSADILDDN